MFVTEHMRTDPAYRDRLRACGLDTVDKVLGQIDGRVAAWSRTTDTLYIPGERGFPGFYVKRHYFPHWSNRFRGALRGTFFGMHRGQSEYLALNSLRAAGVPAVRAVAYGARRLGHFLTACFLITEEVPNAVNLTTFALQVRAGRRTLSRPQRLTLLRLLARQLADMHANGVSHGNLFWRNILIRNAPDGQPEFFVLDPQPLRAWERFGNAGAWWAQELAQVAISSMSFTTRSERLRFMRCYFDCPRLTPDAKSYVRQIDRIAQTWNRHEERRIRMNALFDEWNRQLKEEDSRSGAGLAWSGSEPGS